MAGSLSWVGRLVLAVSLLAAGFATGLRAHELQPAIADLSVVEGQARLSLRVNLDAMLAGINLDVVQDTDEAENAAAYDALRARPGAEIAAMASQLLAGWNALPMLSSDGAPLAVQSLQIRMPQGLDPELTRVAEWDLAAELPRGSEALVLSWPLGAGPLVLRQQGVAEPYTGFLGGGAASPPLAFGGQSGLSWMLWAALGLVALGAVVLVRRRR